MCGIIGYINREKAHVDKKKYAQFIRQAIFCDTLRGHHGTGVLGVNDKGDVSIYKRDLAGPDFLELSKAKDIVDSTDNVVVVAHNRWATRGTASNENTHPFTHGDTTLFHNGTISNYRSISDKKIFNVDSDAAAYLLEKNNPDYTKGLEELEGGYSLVFYNEFEGTLNFARNEEKPMFFCKIKDSNSLLFGSELGMLQWLAVRNGLEIVESFSTKPGTLITIPLDPSVKTSASEFKVKKKEVFSYSNYYQTSHSKKHKYKYLENSEVIVTANSWSPYNNTSNISDDQNGSLSCTSERFPGVRFITSSVERAKGLKLLKTQIKIKVTSVASDDVVYGKYLNPVIAQITDVYKGPNNKLITRAEFEVLTGDGCCFCSANLNKDNTTFDAVGNAYCPECAEEYGLLYKIEVMN